MTVTNGFLFAFFVLTTLVSWASEEQRKKFFARKKVDWVLDVAGLIAQGVLVPMLGLWVLRSTLDFFLPTYRGIWVGSGFLPFFLSFTLIDYLYYWNHRLLHRPSLWWVHRVHHSSQHLDVWSTSRNSLMSTFFLVYVWIYGVFLFVLVDHQAFLWGISASAALDIWRHSNWKTPKFLRMTAGRFLILPEDHSWHHAQAHTACNFGANLNVWDRWHGTFLRAEKSCEVVGEKSEGHWLELLFLPWRIRT